MTEQLIPWGNSTYPAGGNPWNGLPTDVKPAYTYFTPGLPPSAQEMNYLFGSLYTAAVSSTQIGLANYSPQYTLSAAGDGPYAATWDGVGGRWLIATFQPGMAPTFTVRATSGTDIVDTAWATVGSATGSSNPLGSVVALASGTLWVTSPNGNGAGTLLSAHSSGGAWTTVLSTCAGCVDFQAVAAGAYAAYATGTATVNAASIGYLSNAGPVVVQGSLTTSATGWLVGTNGTDAVFITKQAGGSVQNFKFLSAGATVSTSGNLAGQLAAGAVPVALAWSPAFSTWLLACAKSGGGTYFLSSTDGLTWTLQATLSHATNSNILALAALGQGWVGVRVLGTVHTVVYSVDMVNWRASQTQLTGVSGNLATLVQGPTQIMMSPMQDYHSATLQTSNSPVAWSLQTCASPLLLT